MKTIRFAWLAVAGFLAGLSVRADGQSVDAVYLGPGPALTEQGVVEGDLRIDEPAGVQNFDVFLGFSVDPAQSLVTGETVVYAVQDPSNLEDLGVIRRIVGGYYYQTTHTPVDACGAQWAIWEVLGDGPDNPSFSDGMVRLFDPDSEVALRAMAYLDNLADFPSAELRYFTNATRQDMVAMVPETRVFALLGWFGGWLVVWRRRRPGGAGV